MIKKILISGIVLLGTVLSLSAQEKFNYLDVYQLEWISDPQISPDGQKIIYARNYNDIITDQSYSNL